VERYSRFLRHVLASTGLWLACGVAALAVRPQTANIDFDVLLAIVVTLTELPQVRRDLRMARNPIGRWPVGEAHLADPGVRWRSYSFVGALFAVMAVAWGAGRAGGLAAALSAPMFLLALIRWIAVLRRDNPAVELFIWDDDLTGARMIGAPRGKPLIGAS